MPEYHPGTDIEIPDAVPTSGFRCAIPNTKRYMRHNKKTVKHVCKAATEGDLVQLEELLATGDEINLFNGDLNEHVDNSTALMKAAITGQTECVELLLTAKADPHVKERVKHGEDPEDGRTALDFASDNGWDDIMEILQKAETSHPYGWYVPEGKTNNAKVYGAWEWGSKPPKGWYSGRPGVAERMGFDPKKYGTGAYRQPPQAFPIPLPAAPADDAARAKPAAPKAEESAMARKTIPVALLFPGQGSQNVGMLSGIRDIPAVREMLTKAKEILGYDLLDLCLNGPEEQLGDTTYCQPAMFVAGMAAIEKLRADRKEAATDFACTAGLSLGEYTALCAAGVFTFEDGLRLVALRGKAMQEAATRGKKQLMVSIAGIEKALLTQLCRECEQKEGGQAVCRIANELFPKGFSCSGTEVAMLALKDLALEKGALQARQLKTSGAFHTNLMEPAKLELGKALEATLPRMKTPSCQVYMNVNAKPIGPGTKPEEIVELLKQQLTSPVLWEPSVRAMLQAGVTEFYEVGPMTQLKAMMKRIDPKVWSSTTSLSV
eukprot:TRINITY_DN55475_c0_g1_i1.p1 TRINITY_DN55475_c0_g1~~TRINITY_DN55475_c0_g1_i1.p1  ORF type:complete len:548 (+),score=130.25 TRINITY_DN55475_c0_g1_i1:120-1763(+)